MLMTHNPCINKVYAEPFNTFLALSLLHYICSSSSSQSLNPSTFTALLFFSNIIYYHLSQSTVTRNKNLVAHGQKKAIAGRKGKRLGGVVKRAMKAAAPKKK